MSSLARCAFALLAAVLGTALAQPIPPAIATALARADVPPSAVSLLVLPLDGGPARLSHRARAPMNPASVMKLVTTFAALDQLGPDFTWKTRFYADGTLDNGVLDGNLVIRGGGDPKWVIERISADFQALRAQGVREVRGDMVLDSSIFEVPAHDTSAFDDEPLRPYNSGPSGLLVNFKSLLLHFTPDPASHTATVVSEPPLQGLTVQASVPLTSADCAGWRDALRADFSDPDRISFAGRYSARCGDQIWPVAYVDPASFASRVLAAAFAASGGVLDGHVRQGPTPANARLILQAQSLPLSDIISDVNKFSNNVMAQQVFLTLSAQQLGHGSFAASRAVLARWWRQTFGAAGPAAPVLDNGSGLSRDGRISALALAQLLRVAAQQPTAEVFEHSLSLAGVSGTVARMRERGDAPDALGNAWLKTGTLRNVAAMAGYATGLSGRRYVLVGLINHSDASAARAALDALVEWTVRDR
ncbi:MAG: D-alanyl-D-alanine carboxypeptidase/D-alanyl-D-alanine-endopeptidase [Burkholderiaceae bacterium]|nr:MAG: D-alanyl-D-alanine carboxypeptidase/D-alanyl-D-alanine-endopeptidase [Burkholderiaceae bacterium]TBR76307.1 MAG: D-alanyl-D-alanine carboxypeptidase/D-alanyl-D-alanine-endopeptidase [Burkholderiaceae bacterium]